MGNKPFTLTALQREEICQRYIAGESTVKLATAFGVTKANIRQMLITRGIPRRENTAELHRIYQCNHAYFDQPLDEDRAYWIGFLLADGFIARPGKGATGSLSIGMSLASIDKSHIEQFKASLQSNHPISDTVAKGGYGAGYTYSRFQITSNELVEGAGRFGIILDKTTNCATPQLPDELMRHMYRGYVDGDGGLSLYQKRGYADAAFDVVGTKPFLKDFALWLTRRIATNVNVPLVSHNTTVVMNLRYGGIRQVSDILHLLYDNATIYLERKMDTAKCIWSASEKQHSHRRKYYRV